MANLNDEDKNEKESKAPKKEEKKELSIEEKLKDAEDKLLRSLAELENQRKRFDKDIKEAIDFGGFNFAKENLVILDNLQRAYISIKNDPINYYLCIFFFHHNFLLFSFFENNTCKPRTYYIFDLKFA